MKTERIEERFGSIAIVALAVIILLLVASVAVASCLMGGCDDGIAAGRSGTAERAVFFDCPSATEAAVLCLDRKRGIASMPLVGSGACVGRIDRVAELLDECSAGTITDDEAAAAIGSIGLDDPSAAAPIWL